MGAFEEYSEALAKFLALDEKITKYSSLLRSIANALDQGRNRFSFSNTGVGFPIEVTMSTASKSADANDFPTATQINEALAEWHTARKRLSSLWQRMPQVQRDALKPPPAAALAQ